MKFRALVFALLSLCAANSFAAVTFDATASGEGTSVSSISFPLTTSGSDRGLICGQSFYQNVDTSISGVTYNAASLTAVPSSVVGNGNYWVEQYYMAAPASGPNTVQVSTSGNPAFELSAGCVSATNVHQTTPVGTVTTGSGTSTTPSVTVTSATGELVVDTLIIVHSGTLTVGGGQTERWNDVGASGFTKYAGSTEPGAASTAMAWGNSSSQAWAMAGTPFKEVGGGGGGSMPRLLNLLGVGQ